MSSLNLTKIIGGLNSTIGTVNKVIPIYKQVTPIIKNVKSAFSTVNTLKESAKEAEIKEIKSNYVVIENNNIGYQIFVGNPYVYKENEKYTIYLYNYIREDEYSL